MIIEKRPPTTLRISTLIGVVAPLYAARPWDRCTRRSKRTSSMKMRI